MLARFRNPRPATRESTSIEPSTTKASSDTDTSTSTGANKADIDGISGGNSSSAPAVDRAREELQQFVKTHAHDPNLDKEKIETLIEAANSDDPETILGVDREFMEDSPYAEVRAAVRAVDDGEPASTIRAWVLGLFFVTVASGVNMFLSMRQPAINFPSIVVQLVVYPIGCFLARVLPEREFTTFGQKWTLNPGPFNIKEHTVITIMSAVCIDNAYATDALIALQAKSLYNIDFGWGFGLLFILSSQLLGFSFAGFFRRFLVWPAAMIWPGQFANTSLFYALHDKRKPDVSETNGWKISRYRWFVYLGCASFIYYWIPGVLWQGLSVFCFAAWIKPDNVVVNQLFGGHTGLSLIPLTFDWTYVTAYLQDPLLAPTFAHINTLVGLIIFVCITVIGILYTGHWYADYLPLNTPLTFDNTQHRYNVSRILGPNFTFNEAAYKAYSPLFLSPTFVISYGLSFAALTAVLVHTALYHGRELRYRLRTARAQDPDIHLRMMLKYPEVPDGWYAAIFAAALAAGLALCLAFDTHTPWWAFLASNALSILWTIPSSMLSATSNIVLTLNVLGSFIAGHALPGRPVAVIIFKVYATITLARANKFSADLKLGHYMKLPPRTTFAAQVVATAWAALVQLAVTNWSLANIPAVCTPTQKSRFSCPQGTAFYTNSIVWGLVGPTRMFGSSQSAIYTAVHYYWLLGALLPIAFYVLAHHTPAFLARYTRHLHVLNAPVMLGAMAWLPPATPLSFFAWALVGLFFNAFLRSRVRGWWHTYNYVTAAALDCGLVLGTVVVFCAVDLSGVGGPRWWGNEGVMRTKDATYRAITKLVKPGERFGPETW
ncbi:OPT family small oligopeptide transporter [Pseudovirgaria hyperparasitica]|uniref:OPT family small oligopeptide transporter n=1 Tax=Pseudovirgaria hyperparasitica TaxID=470096 RepID=A0A6A6VRW8_9PEZI|nr:OPT family small oligopeptide transporter [Pseudovirgaria hyperparasitica]KAF2753428.1 OPT family small oligopeptide transporter [Pseudovirgaria hyperparasitica]